MGQPAKKFVVFSEIKKAVSIKDILDHYEVLDTFTPKNGGALFGPCPIHKGESKTQFKVDTEKNCWYCFGTCKQGGNILDLVAKMEKVSIREGAILISGWFDLNGQKKKAEGPPPKEPDPEQQASERPYNPPLKFKGLTNLNPEHDSLSQRGFCKETIGTFEAGFFPGKGIMAGRIAIPIHNADGVLVGYAGRPVEDGKEPYKYAKGFRPELEVYNLHRVQESSQKLDFLFLVPDFLDVWRMHQAGFENTVCCLGEVPSEIQINLLLPPQVEEGEREQRALWLLTYNDLDSEEELEVLTSLSKKFFVKIMQFENSISEMDPEEIRKVIDRS